MTILMKKWIAFLIGLVLTTLAAIMAAPMIKPHLSETMAAAEAMRSSGFKLEIVPVTSKVIIIFWIIYAIAVMYIASLPKPQRSGEEEGSSKFIDAAKLVKKLKDNKNPFNDRILSAKVRTTLFGERALASLNSLVVGGMGMGKSFYILTANILQANTSFVVTDPSGELARNTGWFLKHLAGYKVKVVDVDNISNSIHYNFFKYIKTEEDILTLVDIIFDATAEEKQNSAQDPMWDLMAKARLVAYIALVTARGSDIEKNIDTVLWLFENDVVARDKDGNLIETPVMALFNDEEMRNPGNLATRNYMASHRGADETIMGVDSTVSARLSLFLLKPVRSMMSNDELELEKIGKEKTALFLVIPSEKRTFNFIVSMIYTQSFQTLYREAKKEKSLKLPVPVQFLLDEMTNIQLPKDFVEGLTTGRKFNILYMMFVQELAQLETKFKNKKHETVIGTCSTFVYLGASGKNTNEYIAKWIGRQTITTQDSTINYGRHGGSSKQFHHRGRDLIDAAELEKLPSQECIVNIKGHGWTRDKKYETAKHPNFKYHASANGEYFDWSGEANVNCQIEPAGNDIEMRDVINIDIDKISNNKLDKIVTIEWEEY